MAKVPSSQVDQRLRDELATVYAAFILHDDRKDITEESLNKIISASGNEVTPNFVRLFAKATQGQDLDQYLVGGGGAGGSTAAPTGGAQAPAAEKKVEAAPAEQPKEEEEEVEMGDLFGDDF